MKIKNELPQSQLENSKSDLGIVAELKNLKYRKDQLENRMLILESSRDELIDRLTQLDTFMKPCQESNDFKTSLKRFSLRQSVSTPRVFGAEFLV